MNIQEYITAGLDANPDDTAYRLAEEYRTERGRAQARERGFELLTPEAAALVFGKGRSTIARALAKELVPVNFEIQGGFGGPVVRLSTLEDAAAYWGEPNPETLATLRETSHLIGIHGVAWAILSPTPPFKVTAR